MLVIRRRAGEGFLIGLDIEIEVLEVSPTRVKIGIVAPGALPIVRKEVVLTRQENLAASRNAPAQTIAWLSRETSRGAGTRPAGQAAPRSRDPAGRAPSASRSTAVKDLDRTAKIDGRQRIDGMPINS